MCFFGLVSECSNGIEYLGLPLKYVGLYHGRGQCEAGVIHKVDAVYPNFQMPGRNIV